MKKTIRTCKPSPQGWADLVHVAWKMNRYWRRHVALIMADDKNCYASTRMTPKMAREVAAALNKAADEIENGK